MNALLLSSRVSRLARTLFVLLALGAMPAWAWKPITHVYLAEKAREEMLAQGGAVTLHLVDFNNRQQGAALGTWGVSGPILQALRDYPAYYRAGVLGPDAYPDLLFGQSVIHPARENIALSGSDSDPWLRHLYARASTPAERAFVLGFLAHGAGDMFGHTFINHYAVGRFAFENGNAKRHIVAEGHVGRNTPFLGDRPQGEPARYTIDTSAVNGFIYDQMIDARRSRDGSWSNEVWNLTRGTSILSLPRLFTELRAGLEDKVDAYYEHVRWLKQKYRENADRCDFWHPGACAKALYYKALLVAYNVIAGIPAYYMEAWVRDINRGLKAWPQASTDVARALFMQTNHKGNFDGAKSVLSTYSDRYLCSMMGAPDAFCWLSNAIENVINAITFKLDLFRALKQRILNYAVEKATGESLDYWKGLMDPEPSQVDQEVPANPAGPLQSSAQIDQLMYASGNPRRFDMLRFAPAYNTYASIKMSFLDTRAQWKSVLGAAGWNTANLDGLMNAYDAPRGFQGQLMLGFLRSMDWDNEFAETPDRLFVAQDCMQYTRLFMQQTGDLWEKADRRNDLMAWCGRGGNRLTYNASATGSATSQTVNRDIPLVAGETLTLGTCGVAGASGSGDTYLRLFSPWGTEVVANDDACGGVQSNFSYTVPANASGTYQLRAGCWGGASCGGTAVWIIRGAFSYSAANTNSGTVNVSTRDLSLVEGQRLKVGTCNVDGASANGDTLLRLYNATGTQVAYNDDACGGLMSYFEYDVPWGTSGTHPLRAGCWADRSCSGTVSYQLTDASL